MTVRELIQRAKLLTGGTHSTDRRDLELLAYLDEFRKQLYDVVRHWEIEHSYFARSVVNSTSSPEALPSDYLATDRIYNEDGDLLEYVPYPYFASLDDKTGLWTLWNGNWYIESGGNHTIYYWPQLNDLNLTDNWPSDLEHPALSFLRLAILARDRFGKYDVAFEAKRQAESFFSALGAMRKPTKVNFPYADAAN